MEPPTLGAPNSWRGKMCIGDTEPRSEQWRYWPSNGIGSTDKCSSFGEQSSDNIIYHMRGWRTSLSPDCPKQGNLICLFRSISPPYEVPKMKGSNNQYEKGSFMRKGGGDRMSCPSNKPSIMAQSLTVTTLSAHDWESCCDKPFAFTD